MGEQWVLLLENDWDNYLETQLVMEWADVLDLTTAKPMGLLMDS